MTKRRSSVSHIRTYGNMARMDSNGEVVAVTGDYRTTVLAKESHADCFLAVIFFQEDALGRPVPTSTAIAFRNIGQLVGGRSTDLRIDTSYLVKPGVTFYSIPLIFAKGVEVRSSQSEVASRFFRSEEMTAHAEVLSNYKKQYATENRPASPYLRFPPQLPSNVDPTSLPPVVKTTFAVTEEGEVDDLEIDPALLDPAVRHDIRNSISGWLFLPCLKQGVPTRITMSLPLAFSSPGK